MTETPTELGRVVISRGDNGAPQGHEFHPFEYEHDWQKRRFVDSGDTRFLDEIVSRRAMMLVGGDSYAVFEVAARFSLSGDGNINGILKLAVFSGDAFVEILR